MGIAIFPDISFGGVFPMFLINIALAVARIKRAFVWIMEALGLIQRSSISNGGLEEYIYFAVCSEEIKKALPVSIYVPDADGKARNSAHAECTVCLCEFQNGQEIRLLPTCKHIFHSLCLDQWLEHQHITCPLCRAPFAPANVLPKNTLPREQEISDDLNFWVSWSVVPYLAYTN